MNERIKAAAWEISAVDYPNYEPDHEIAAKVLEAADAVLFSDEAVEGAAKSLYDLGAYQEWDKRSEELRELYREDVRAVIAALKGDA